MNFLNSFSNLRRNAGVLSFTWSQIGEDINGGWDTDYAGWSVSMNYTGNIIAFSLVQSERPGGAASEGEVRVLQWNGTAWTQMGVDIYGEAGLDQSGYSISMNAAGDRIAIGAIFNDGTSGSTTDNRGHTRIYQWNGTAWTQMGVDIDGEAADDQSGYSVSMNAAGDRVAISAKLNDGTSGSTTDNRGHVRVFQWNGTAWTQMGVDIDGETTYDQSGHSISINAAGNRVAIGSWSNESTGLDRGHTRIYQWNGTAWTQMGVDIDGESSQDKSGYSVSINAAGNRVAIGAIANLNGGYYNGHVRVFEWNGTAWTRMGVDIDWTDVYGDTQVGWSVSMNLAGDRVAIGANLADAFGQNSGAVRIYSWNGSAWSQLGAQIRGEAAFDQSGYSVSMNAAGDRVVIGAPLNNSSGFTDSGHVRVYQLF